MMMMKKKNIYIYFLDGFSCTSLFPPPYIIPSFVVFVRWCVREKERYYPGLLVHPSHLTCPCGCLYVCRLTSRSGTPRAVPARASYLGIVCTYPRPCVSVNLFVQASRAWTAAVASSPLQILSSFPHRRHTYILSHSLRPPSLSSVHRLHHPVFFSCIICLITLPSPPRYICIPLHHQ